MCDLAEDGTYKNPNLIQRIMKDMLDPGGLVHPAGTLQVLQVMLAKVYLVVRTNKDDVLLGSMEAWRVLCCALVKFASLGPRSVWTNQCVLRYASDSRLRLVCQWVCTFIHVPAMGMLCGKSQGAQLMRQPSVVCCLEHGEISP